MADVNTATGISSDQNRLLSTLEQLLLIDVTDLTSAMNEATIFWSAPSPQTKLIPSIYDPSTSTLIAVGTSHTEMGKRQHELGLHLLPLANGGRTVEVFVKGETYITGHADQDPAVLPGIKNGLGVRSMIVAPLQVGGTRRGVLSAVSAREEHFSEADLRFLSAAARWVGALAHRAELAARLKRQAVEQARRMTAEQMVAVLSHDLGNRLTPAIGRVDLIRRQARKESNEKVLQSAEAAYKALQNINSLIQDLLDVSRIEQGLFSLNIQSVDLAALARQAAELLRGPGTNANITVRVVDALPAEADAMRIRQALENLLTNAIKHGPTGVPVTLQLDTQQRDKEQWAIFTVRDEGPGIEPDLLPRLFTPFVAGSTSSGLGLGLFTTYGIAQAHGGDLTVESTQGDGSSFFLAIPVRQPQPS